MEITSNDRAQEGASAAMPTPWEPYREYRPIRSAGRTSLTDAFSNYMALTSGISPQDIASAFDITGDAGDQDLIEREIRFLAGIFLDGGIRTFARLAGGGEPVELPASAWEIDDAISRFATGSLNADRPHDLSAPATHWLFVDSADWDAAMNGLRQSRLKPFEDWGDAGTQPDETPVAAVVHSTLSTSEPIDVGTAQSAHEPWRNEILSLDGVVNATGLKRSTIYSKVAAGSFPRQLAIHGTRKGWRRGEVQDWLDALAR